MMLVYFCTDQFHKSKPRQKSYQPQKRPVNTFTINESDEVELLGLTIDKELNFSKHIDKLCRNAQYKLHALRRIRNYLSL